MVFVERLSDRLAIAINKNADQAASVAVLSYALNNFIKMVFLTSLILILSLVTGRFYEGITACFAFYLLRYFSGGIHFKSEQACNVISTILILLAIYTPVNYWYNGFILNIITIVLLLVFAPSNMKKSKLDPKYYPVLKLISVLIVTMNFFLHSPVLSIAFFLQATTIVSIFQMVLTKKNW